MIDWKIDSWRQFPIKQVPEYSDKSSVEKVEKELSIRPPLVFAEEARRLRKRMADVAEGKAFCYRVVIVLNLLQNITQTI
jgi:3-deoxy-7-phosphoheptulonate synthase